MLPLNIGLPRTPHGLFLDRCHEPCPSVILNTDQPSLQPRPPSLDLMLPQHQPNQDYCFLVSVMGVKPRQLHQMADSTNPSLGGCVTQWYYLWVIPKITGGFRVIAPFTISWKMLILLPGHQFNFVWLAWGQGHQQGQGHTKVKVIPRSNFKCLTFYWQAGGGPSTERHSCSQNVL